MVGSRTFELVVNVKTAKELGLKIIVFGSGGARKVPEGFSQDEAYKQLVEFAKRIAPEAKKRGIVVAVEPLRSSTKPWCE